MEAGSSTKLVDVNPISYFRTGLVDHCRPVAAIGPVCQAFDSVDLTCCPVAAVCSVDSVVSYAFLHVSRRFAKPVQRVLTVPLDWTLEDEVALVDCRNDVAKKPEKPLFAGHCMENR